MKNKDGIALKVGQVWKISDSNKNWIDQVKWRVIGFHDIYVALGSESSGFVHHCVADRLTELFESHDGADFEAARAEGWEVHVDGIEEPVWGEVEKIEQYNQGDWCYPTCRAMRLDDGTTLYDLDPDHTYRYKLKVNTCEHCSKAESECECFGITTCSACHHRETCESRMEGYESIGCDGFRGTSCLACPKCGNQDELVASLNGQAVCYDCGRPQHKLFEIKWGEVPWLPGGGATPRKATVGQWHNGYRIFGFTDRNEPGYCCEMSITPCDHTGNRKYAIGRLEDGR